MWNPFGSDFCKFPCPGFAMPFIDIYMAFLTKLLYGWALDIGWLLMINKPEFMTAAVIANCTPYNRAGTWHLDELTSKNMYLRRIPKHLYEASLQRSLGGNSLLPVSGPIIGVSIVSYVWHCF
ncbi:uncharacterized protein LOC122279404 isoform X2 [Carya illinoinensis]|uniref:uncharacterized protein LOC122279404 isoform X2 n=1 Tax=Carya illinoinensis TaxID=32201 RepID=UPI001C721F97|nr:uncharacterized protein LOC122279404 isoform X2 [Carya illinoinensis]